MDVAAGQFALDTQQRLWALVSASGGLHGLPGVRSLVLGVNNLMVVFDQRATTPDALRAQLEAAFCDAAPRTEVGRLLELPVRYDRAGGSELESLARHVGLGVDEVVREHTSVDYHVACIGSVPGFPYLVGLPRALAMPRHATPRPRIAKGSVAIGGAQTGIIPMDMPSGWHVLGTTDVVLFDATRSPPSLLAPGDRIRFLDRRSV